MTQYLRQSLVLGRRDLCLFEARWAVIAEELAALTPAPEAVAVDQDVAAEGSTNEGVVSGLGKGSTRAKGSGAEAAGSRKKDKGKSKQELSGREKRKAKEEEKTVTNEPLATSSATAAPDAGVVGKKRGRDDVAPEKNEAKASSAKDKSKKASSGRGSSGQDPSAKKDAPSVVTTSCPSAGKRSVAAPAPPQAPLLSSWVAPQQLKLFDTDVFGLERQRVAMVADAAATKQFVRTYFVERKRKEWFEVRCHYYDPRSNHAETFPNLSGRLRTGKAGYVEMGTLSGGKGDTIRFALKEVVHAQSVLKEAVDVAASLQVATRGLTVSGSLARSTAASPGVASLRRSHDDDDFIGHVLLGLSASLSTTVYAVQAEMQTSTRTISEKDFKGVKSSTNVVELSFAQPAERPILVCQRLEFMPVLQEVQQMRLVPVYTIMPRDAGAPVHIRLPFVVPVPTALFNSKKRQRQEKQCLSEAEQSFIAQMVAAYYPASVVSHVTQVPPRSPGNGGGTLEGRQTSSSDQVDIGNCGRPGWQVQYGAVDWLAEMASLGQPNSTKQGGETTSQECLFVVLPCIRVGDVVALRRTNAMSGGALGVVRRLHVVGALFVADVFAERSCQWHRNQPLEDVALVVVH